MATNLDHMTYADAARKLGNKQSVRPNGSNNALLVRGDNGDIAYRLHDTTIVTFHPDNTATLRSGGWRTSTTKRHLGVAARVWQKDFEWYVGEEKFFDGMRVTL